MSASSTAPTLHYVNDSQPGIRRWRRGQGFSYIRTDGAAVTDPQVLSRIRSLAIPPAWKNVWICPAAEGHLQATGRDARGRKQYRYHPLWQELRGAKKFDRLLTFGRSLPRLRRRVRRDLRLTGMPRERVLALIVRLLDMTALRVGNAAYARVNQSFGLTTLRNHHARFKGSRMQLTFRGKSGLRQSVQIDNRRLTRLVKRCQDLPGQELFCFIDDFNEVQSVGSADVNDYVRLATGEDFSAKDFRTWAGTLLAWEFLIQQPRAESTAKRRRIVRQAVKHVATTLGNTPAVCRKFYIHPAVLEAFASGSPPPVPATTPQSPRELKSMERTLLGFLRRLERNRNRSGTRVRSAPARRNGIHPRLGAKSGRFTAREN